MGNLWETYGKPMTNPWNIYRKYGKPMGDFGIDGYHGHDG